MRHQPYLVFVVSADVFDSSLRLHISSVLLIYLGASFDSQVLVISFYVKTTLPLFAGLIACRVSFCPLFLLRYEGSLALDK